MPGYGARPGEESEAALSRLYEYAGRQGRDRSEIGIEKVLDLDMGPEEQWRGIASSWRDAGVDRVSISTMNAGLAAPEDHIDAIRRFKAALAGL
jgi:hypothetical protein